MYSKLKLNKKAGFTFIELLVVISIISVLSSVVLASTKNVRASARDTTRKQTVRQMDLAIKMFANDNGGNVPKFASCGNDVLACTAQSSDTSLTGNWNQLKTDLAPYMSKLPDSLNNIDYVYIGPTENGDPTAYQISAELETVSGSNNQTGYSNLNPNGTLVYVVSPNNTALTASMSGPTSLTYPNSNGTWTITASNPNNDTLTYTIDTWNDISYSYDNIFKKIASYFINTAHALPGGGSLLPPVVISNSKTNTGTSASFDHTYVYGGNHNIQYTVWNQNTGEVVTSTYTVMYYNLAGGSI